MTDKTEPRSPTEEVRRGQAYLNHTGKCSVFVMAVADGYAMVRYKGCMPFAVSLPDLKTKFTRNPDADRQRRKP